MALMLRRVESSWLHSADTKWALQPHTSISDTAWPTAWACGHPVGADVNILHWPEGGIVMGRSVRASCLAPRGTIPAQHARRCAGTGGAYGWDIPCLIEVNVGRNMET